MKVFYLFFLFMLTFSIGYSQDSTRTSVRKIKIKKKFNEADLFPRLCGKLVGSISFKEIESDPVLRTIANLKIVSFEMSLRVGSGELVYSSGSERLTGGMLEKIANLKPGERILFHNIKTKHYTGKLIKLQPLELEYR